MICSVVADQSILNHERTEIIFGSDFPLDQTDLQICLNIQQVSSVAADDACQVTQCCIQEL
jgi:hypothetical protein